MPSYTNNDFYKIFGLIGLTGCVGGLVTSIVGIAYVEEHDPISETISKLAIGKHAWIQDLGLNMLGVAAIIVAIGLYMWRKDGIKWKLGIGSLLLLGIDIVIIAEYDYYNLKSSELITVHFCCVVLLGILFAIATYLLAFGLRTIHSYYFKISLAICIIWIFACPIFFIISTKWDGAYERFLALILIFFIAMLSWLLIQKSKLSKEKTY